MLMPVSTQPEFTFSLSIIKNGKLMCKICSTLTIKIPEQGYWRCSGVLIIKLEQISHIALVIPYLTLNKYILVG